VDAFLAIKNDPTLPEVDQSYIDPEGDILLLEVFLNDDPSLPPTNQGNYLPEVRKELKSCEAKSDKSLIDEPPEVEHKDLPPHLEYAFLKGDDKFPVIIAKDLSVEEKTVLITVLKSHKRAIAWKLSDIKDFDADPRVPLILKRSFLKTGRALIDVFEANYNDMTAKRIDVIDMACKEYSQEVLGFYDVIASGNPTPYYDLIVSTTSLTLTPFRNSDFLLEEVDAFLAIKNDPTLPEVDQSYIDPEGDILLLEVFLNDDPSLPSTNQGNYLPEVRKELKSCEAKSDKSLID
nr:reverse transcriptase domain-containing protein [Tanacetum cinerariifolium]